MPILGFYMIPLLCGIRGLFHVAEIFSSSGCVTAGIMEAQHLYHQFKMISWIIMEGASEDRQ